MPHPLPPTPPGVDETKWADAVAEVRAYCGWHIAPVVTETVTLDGPGGGLLILPTLRLVDVVSLTSDGVPVVAPEWSRTGMVRGVGWSRTFRGITAEIAHGYEEWPADLLGVTADLITSASRDGVSGYTSGPYQVSYEGPLSGRQRDVLDRYSLVALA